MKKLRSKKQILLYSMAGLGVNMLNLIVGTYLCDALMVEGFSTNIENWTYANKTLVVAGVWSVMIFLAKVLDGVIDIPFAAWTDNLKTRWGKRRPAILIGLVPMVLCFILFLFPPHSEATWVNTIYLGLSLCGFYTFYTLTMVTYYATFSEIVDNDKDRVLLSNFKSVFDVVYFVLGYALIPLMIGSANIRTIAFIFLPLVSTMLIALFMIKENSTKEEDVQYNDEQEETVGLFDSLKYAIKNKDFILWMGVYFLMQFGVQMFLSGENVYCSGVALFSGGQITILNALSFAPVPFTLIIYNKIINKYGFKIAFRYSLGVFSFAMIVFTLINSVIIPDDTIRFIVGCIAALICSFSIGSFFSIGYVVPSGIAVREKEQTGISHPAMYFAVQGLVGGISTGISTGLIWVTLKNTGNTWMMGIVVAVVCVLSLLFTRFLPESLNSIGKVEE